MEREVSTHISTPLHLLQYSFFPDFHYSVFFPPYYPASAAVNFLLNNILLLHVNNIKILMQLLVNAITQKNSHDIG